VSDRDAGGGVAEVSVESGDEPTPGDIRRLSGCNLARSLRTDTPVSAHHLTSLGQSCLIPP